MTQSPGQDPEDSGQPPYGNQPYPSGQQPPQQQPPQNPQQPYPQQPGSMPPGGQPPYAQQPYPQQPGAMPPGGQPPYAQHPGGPGYQHPGGPGMHGGAVDPATGMPLSDKSKVVAGLLQLLLGGVGAGRFYTGHTGMAVGQLVTCGGCGIWSLIDGIQILINGGTDSDGRVLRDS